GRSSFSGRRSTVDAPKSQKLHAKTARWTQAAFRSVLIYSAGAGVVPPSAGGVAGSVVPPSAGGVAGSVVPLSAGELAGAVLSAGGVAASGSAGAIVPPSAGAGVPPSAGADSVVAGTSAVSGVVPLENT